MSKFLKINILHCSHVYNEWSRGYILTFLFYENVGSLIWLKDNLSCQVHVGKHIEELDNLLCAYVWKHSVQYIKQRNRSFDDII